MSPCGHDEREEQSVAVIGMALRVPGASSLSGFWENLIQGRVCRERVPDGELSAGLHAQLWQEKGYVPYRYSIEGYELFDADFFQVSPREAGMMDPQHRLILEYSIRAFENAGYRPEDDDGIRTGVFACADVSHYLMGHLYPHFCNGSIDVIETFLGTGNDFLATRVAYKCNFTGPAMTIQTACSSSLTSLHMAVLSLLGGECDRAVVASGTILLPDLGYLYRPGGIHSPDGLCRPFDTDAQGTVFSNGAVAVVLKPLRDALRDRDHVWAVIRGTASANDGSDKIGFVAPSASGQARAIRSALAVAGCAPEDIAYVEGHGTGTQLGDPIEVEALLRVFGSAGERCAAPIILGSVKGNVGHLNATAGLCGFVKTCLCVHHGFAPGTANFSALNPALGDIAPFAVSAGGTALERRAGAPLLAGVSSFGFGGTNVHAVVQEPPRVCSPGPEPTGQAHLLLLSSPYKDGLREMQEQCARCLEETGVSLADAAYTLAVGRRHRAWRSAVVAQDRGAAVRRLLAAPPPRRAVARDGAVAFLFPGQGNLHAYAGLGLYENDALFRECLDEVARVLLAHGGPDILDVMRRNAADAGAASLASTAVAQPLLFGLETAFARALAAKGVRPDCVLGHSLGEYAAAVQAGIFSLEDGARLVVGRAALMQAAPPGRMLMVTLHRDVLRDVLGALFDLVELSVVNGPANCVLSGRPEALDACLEAVERYGQRGLYLKTSHAFHSIDMEGVLEPFRRILDTVELRPPGLPIASNVTGAWGAEEMARPDYWLRHLRQTVEFDRCLASVADRASLGIEIGPGHVMRSLGTRPDLGLTVCPGLDAPGVPPGPGGAPGEEPRSMLHVVGDLWVHGGGVDWRQFHAPASPRRCPMPETVLRPQRYWVDPAPVPGAAAEGASLGSLMRENRAAPAGEHVPPANDTERQLVEIWQELLLVRPIGTNEDFLALGGNSVQVMQMLRLAGERGLSFSAREVFEARTVKELARRVRSEAPGRAAAAIAMPSFFRAHAGADRRFHAVFDCPGEDAPERLGALAQGLAARHDILRLRWDASGATLLGKEDSASWAGEHVHDGLTLPPDAVERLCASPFALLPAACPPCDGRRPWYLAPVARGSSGERLVLAVFSWALCDKPGADALCREIDGFLRSGGFPDEPLDSWLAWVAGLPPSLLSNPVTARGAGPRSVAGQADAPGGGGACSVAIEKAGMRAMIEQAGGMARMSPGDLAACALVGVLCGESPRAGAVTMWRNMRDGWPTLPPVRHGAGSYAVPVHIALDDDPPTEEAVPIPRFKEALLRAVLDGGARPATGERVDFFWLEPEPAGHAAPQARASVGPPADCEAPLALYAFADRDALIVSSSHASARAGALMRRFAEHVVLLVEGVVERGEGCGLVPADFPLCDLRGDELGRILREAGQAAEDCTDGRREGRAAGRPPRMSGEKREPGEP